ncbi:hypothetical protein, partial [Agathobaculum sp.]|uniref:hypothetical protein n=1 Tax=Agathobaculum sp. TaxID=2048138 RepID=UPI003A877A94
NNRHVTPNRRVRQGYLKRCYFLQMALSNTHFPFSILNFPLLDFPPKRFLFGLCMQTAKNIMR